MSTITWSLTADLDRDDTFEADLTSYVTAAGRGLQVVRGVGNDGLPRASTVRIDLDNSTGVFTKNNRSSAFYGRLESNVPIRITATFLGDSFTVWTGYVHEYKTSFRAGRVPIAQLECTDLIGVLSDSDPVYVTMSTTRDTDGAIDAIRSALGLAAGDVSLDDGITDLPYHWVAGQDALDAIGDVLAAEMGGTAWVNASGVLRFESRNSRLGTTPDYHWGDYPDYKHEVLIDQPVGYWRLGESSGTSAGNIGSEGSAATYVSAPTLGEASALSVDPNTSITLDGTADEVTFGAEFENETGDWSYEAWVKPTRLVDGSWQHVIGGAGGAYALGVKYASGTGLFTPQVTCVTVADAPSCSATIEPSVWSHLAVTFDDATNTLTYYVNGVAANAPNFATPPTSGATRLGRSTAYASWFGGGLDEVATYASLLSAARIAAHYNAGIGRRTSTYPRAIAEVQRDEDITTAVRARATVLATGQANEEFFRFSRGMHTQPTADSISLATKTSYDRTFVSTGPYLSITTPVSGVDYAANDSADGTGTDRTSSLTVTVTDLGGASFRIQIYNGHTGTVYLTKFRLRGQTTPMHADRPESYFSQSVSGRKAGKTANIDIPFASDNSDLADYAQQYLQTFRYPTPEVQAEFVPRNDLERYNLLSLELGEMVRYRDEALGVDLTSGDPIAGAYVDDWYYVESLTYDIPPNWAGQSFVCKVRLVPSYIWRRLSSVEWDTFPRADASGDLGTSDSGSAWANDGNFDIASNTARANANTQEEPDLTVGQDDQVVHVQLAAMAGDDEVGIDFRKTDASNTYRAVLDYTLQELRVEREESGTIWTLGPEDSATIRSGNEITQATRARAYEGDGNPSTDESIGVWANTSANELYAHNNDIDTTTFAGGVGDWTTNGTNSIASSTDQAKFGTTSLKCTYQDDATLANIVGITLTAAERTWSVYMYIPSDYDGGAPRLEQTAFASATGDVFASADGGLTDQWQRVDITFTPDAGDLVGNFRINASAGAPTAGKFIYIAAPQSETGPIPTPFTATSRGAPSITMDVGDDIDEGQWWWAARFRIGWDYDDAPNAFPTIGPEWGDSGSSRFIGFWFTANNTFVFNRNNGTNQSATIASTHARGDEITLVGRSLANSIGIGLNGGAWNDTAGAFIPTLAATTYTLGMGDNPAGVDYFWLAVGRGTLPDDADSATLDGYGNTPPTRDQINADISTADCRRVYSFRSNVWTPAATAELRAIIQDQRVRVWRDFQLEHDEEDLEGLTTGTKAGLFALNASGSTTFDNFHAIGLD